MSGKLHVSVRVNNGPVVEGNGEGYDVAYHVCALCVMEIEPKRLPDPGPKMIPGLMDWRVTVRTFVEPGEVSLRMAADGGEFFGIAAVGGAIISSLDGASTKLLGAGPLGRRNKSPRCTCPLIDTGSPGKPSFARGDPTNCRLHGGRERAAIEEAKRAARGEVPDPFYEAAKAAADG
jgi:hypothetical protein